MNPVNISRSVQYITRDERSNFQWMARDMNIAYYDLSLLRLLVINAMETQLFSYSRKASRTVSWWWGALAGTVKEG